MNPSSNSSTCKRGSLAPFLVFPKCIQCWLNYEGNTYAPLALRLFLAYEFLEAGLEKLSGENWFSELVFPFPFNLLSADMNWMLSTGLEIIGPITLILGLATRFFSLALIVLTLIAIATVHWPTEWHTLQELWKGYVFTDQGYGNYKLPLIYVFMLVSLVFSGAGKLSLDAWLFYRNEPATKWIKPK
ncbi:DoxX family protein [Methylomonas sp. AM2-LC]|uniref:HvfX family Cu-binding RiPP maturation protein n=1 Tax=Methylomonas sp. AM2-LC TaxID=3153301 RepID=UPI0032667423